MAKNKEAFNKRENEIKRLKKKKEKVEKKEARKASGDKGADFNDMIAYVDENGNLSSTPPDPSRRIKVDASTIQLGVQKREETESVDPTRTGIVTFFNDSKGYGFIQDQQSKESIFVHINGLIDKVQEREKVTFEVERTPRGLSAIKVKLFREKS
jgi:cold shock CspA family protein